MIKLKSHLSKYEGHAMSATVNIRPELKAELDKLAASTQRSQSDLANQALEMFIEHEKTMVEKIRLGLAQAERREFVPEEEMDAFFAQRSAPDAQ